MFRFFKKDLFFSILKVFVCDWQSLLRLYSVLTIIYMCIEYGVWVFVD